MKVLCFREVPLVHMSFIVLVPMTTYPELRRIDPRMGTSQSEEALRYLGFEPEREASDFVSTFRLRSLA